MLWLHGAGHFHPEAEITNRFLEALDIGTTESWILERVGIRSRRTVLPLEYIRATYNQDPRAGLEAATYTNADTGRRAAEMAMARAGITGRDVGLVLAGSCAPDTTAPAEACNIAAALGIEAPAFDLNSACSTFGAHLYTLSLMRPEALPAFVLLVITDNTTRVVDFRDRRGAVLWGDGSAAVVVSTRAPGRFAVLAAELASSPAGHKKVLIPRLGHFTQDGPAVQKFAISKTVHCLTALRAAFAAVAPRAFHFIGHQANRLMLESVCRSARLAPEQHHSNVTEFGNTGAAGAPSVLSAAWDRFATGDHIAMVCVGSGLTWSSLMLRCEHGWAPTNRTQRPAAPHLLSEEVPSLLRGPEALT
jgi:3-oxoacyl-[acyl-carrier-protein] synthase-3